MTKLSEVRCAMNGEIAVATVVGEFDIGNCDEMSRQIQASCADALAIVLDLSETQYLDSAALRTLFTIARMFQGRGAPVVAVIPATGLVRKVTVVSGIDAVMPVAETRDEGLRLAGGPVA